LHRSPRTRKTSRRRSKHNQAKASKEALKALEGGAKEKIEAFIAEQAISRGAREIVNFSDEQKPTFLQQAIDSL